MIAEFVFFPSSFSHRNVASFLKHEVQFYQLNNDMIDLRLGKLIKKKLITEIGYTVCVNSSLSMLK